MNGFHWNLQNLLNTFRRLRFFTK